MFEMQLLIPIAWIFLITVSFVVFVIALANTVRNAVLMIGAITPEASFFSDLYLNRFNVLFKPHLLTQKGLEARKRLLFWLLIFIVSAVLLAAFSELGNYG